MKQWTAFSAEYLSARVKCPIFGGLVDNEVRVVENFLPNLDLVVTTGVKPHSDGRSLPPWAALLVIQANGLIAKSVNIGKESLSPQLVGTIVVMNIHNIHHCIPDSRNLNVSGQRVWAALRKDYKLEPSQTQVEEDFRLILR